MCRTYQEYPFDQAPEASDVKLSLLDRILLKCGLPVPIGDYQLKDWRAPITWYVFECEYHGLVTNYKQGHSQRLNCPKCQDERSNWRRERASRSSENVEMPQHSSDEEDKEALSQ